MLAMPTHSSLFGVGCRSRRLSIAPNPSDPVANDELLLRSIDGDLAHGWENGKLRLASTSFNDRGMKVSVDRERLQRDLKESLQRDSDGLARVVARDVRAIDLGDAQKKTSIPVDVTPDPLDAPPHPKRNPAHALIAATSEINGSRFQRLKEKLARLAEKDLVLLPAKYRGAQPPP